MSNIFTGIWRSVPAKIRPWIISLACGSTLLLFWAYLDRAGKMQFAAPPAAEPVSSGQQTARPAAQPSVPGGYYGDDGEYEPGDDDGERGTGSVPSTQPPAPAVATPAPTPTPTPAPTAAGNYRDGTYKATSGAPWGPMTIEVTVVGGRWTAIKNVAIPDSPPSYYAVTYLVQQALRSQSATINGVSGATYTSDAFRNDLKQIVSLSKK